MESSFTATTEPAPGDTDVNPDNDQVEQAVLVGQATVADLSLTSFALGPGSATEVGKPMDFVAEVLNQGPDASLVVQARVVPAFGNVDDDRTDDIEFLQVTVAPAG